MNVEKLIEEMGARGVSVNDLSRRSGIDRSALDCRFKSGGKNLTVEEAKKIADALSLERETAVSIFLQQKSQ